MSELILKLVRPLAAPAWPYALAHRAAAIVRPLIFPALILAVWQGLGSFSLIDPVLLPTPTKVLGALYEMVISGYLNPHLAISFQRVLLGFAAGSAVAIVIGALTGYSTWWRSIIDPTIHAIRTIPGLAWIPMFILWLGIDEGSKVVLIAKASFFPTYLNFMSGIARADRKLIEVGQVYRLRGVRLITKVLLPHSLPFLFVGLRQSMGVAWLVVVAAELMGASSGIGYVLLDGEMTGRAQIVMACMIVFALCGKTTDLIIARIAQRVLSWQDTVEKE
ncbi:ABC transporter permease [Uliginosibacterium aquaticum]|uniref:ABC transporter permease n=1 Tax=Uliginosibacterium aquaticum TaxID=2731212 RepID=A0ABX2IGQ6_9RHOO|nr:ABC transporter permease [Uliginosibacterium aquaticum]NSL55063.1 ABC transporter permease [Uliginosibacterium aquaticum]